MPQVVLPTDIGVRQASQATFAPGAALAGGGGLGAPVPAWLVVFASGLSLALGYCLALLAH
jgi:hypothetical protein